MAAGAKFGLDPRAHCPGTSWGSDEAPGEEMFLNAWPRACCPGTSWGWDKPWEMRESVTPGSLPGDAVRFHLLGCAFLVSCPSRAVPRNDPMCGPGTRRQEACTSDCP